jgi:hypothetical protein
MPGNNAISSLFSLNVEKLYLWILEFRCLVHLVQDIIFHQPQVPCPSLLGMPRMWGLYCTPCPEQDKVCSHGTEGQGEEQACFYLLWKLPPISLQSTHECTGSKEAPPASPVEYGAHRESQEPLRTWAVTLLWVMRSCPLMPESQVSRYHLWSSIKLACELTRSWQSHGRVLMSHTTIYLLEDKRLLLVPNWPHFINLQYINWYCDLWMRWTTIWKASWHFQCFKYFTFLWWEHLKFTLISFEMHNTLSLTVPVVQKN